MMTAKVCKVTGKGPILNYIYEQTIKIATIILIRAITIILSKITSSF